ncbi:hypothetical protein ACOJBO_12295 [Rhizobium beringeri]
MADELFGQPSPHANASFRTGWERFLHLAWQLISWRLDETFHGQISCRPLQRGISDQHVARIWIDEMFAGGTAAFAVFQ